MFEAGRRSNIYRVLASLSVASVLLAEPNANAEIFKCVAKDGLPLYQNFPCDLDSMGSLPSVPAGTNTAAVNDRERKLRPAQAATQKPTHAAELSVHMTSDEV